MYPRTVYRPVEQEDSDDETEKRALGTRRSGCDRYLPRQYSNWQRFLRLTCLLPTFFLLLMYLYLNATLNNTESCALQREIKLQNRSRNSNLFRSTSNILPSERFARLGQKGATIWFTGLSGSGKSTIGKAVERLLLQNRAHVVQLDGDNLRMGLNQDLDFSNADRRESIRRAGEVAALFSETGVIALVTLISPFRKDRKVVREMHKQKGIPFYEVFVDVNISVAIERDPKGLYARAIKGEIKDFTGISSPYEPPTQPEIHLDTATMSVEEEAHILMRYITARGILTGKQVVDEYTGIAVADGVGTNAEFQTRYPTEMASKYADMDQYPRVLLRHEDVHWLQVIGEGWASPLKGFMREGVYLQSLHFSSALYAGNTTEMDLLSLSPSNSQSNFSLDKAERISFPVPIVLPIHNISRTRIGTATKVILVGPSGEDLAILHDPEIYPHRKDERIARTFGTSDTQHPAIQEILRAGDLLLGGEVEMLQRVRYKDGLDVYRLTPTELRQRFKQMNADIVVAFQTRNPTHAGHVYLMDAARQQLVKKGFKNPVLWLSPLGGWTKDDDVPLDVRIKQHEAVLSSGMLNASSTVLAIWPSPMIYAGPKEVQWHAKSRRNAGASVFIVGRDPAGIKSHGNDLYHQDHGRFVLHVAPGLESLQLMSFDKVYYDVRDHQMKPMETDRKADFLSISGTRMRKMAEKGLVECSGDIVPKTWEENPTCVPRGFMVDSGWQIMIEYYKHRSFNWLAFSIQQSKPFLDSTRSFQSAGTYGQPDFKLFFQDTNSKLISPWHDIPLLLPEKHLYNFVVEIPKGVMYKMEVNKEHKNNPIMQDTTHNGTRGRTFLYGIPFFNYGMFPQTWENPKMRNTDGNGGDNDPLDVLEIGSRTLPMGSVNPVKILGSLALIDQGEIDHKILALSIHDPEADRIHSVDDLRPGLLNDIIDWLRNYKTAEGYPINHFTQGHPLPPKEAEEIIISTHDQWKALRNGSIEQKAFFLGTSS